MGSKQEVVIWVITRSFTIGRRLHVSRILVLNSWIDDSFGVLLQIQCSSLELHVPRKPGSNKFLSPEPLAWAIWSPMAFPSSSEVCDCIFISEEVCPSSAWSRKKCHEEAYYKLLTSRPLEKRELIMSRWSCSVERWDETWWDGNSFFLKKSQPSKVIVLYVPSIWVLV